MKNSKWKMVIQILISILTALGTSPQPLSFREGLFCFYISYEKTADSF